MEILNKIEALRVVGLIATAGKKMDERIHQVGCSGLYEYQESGNLEILTTLVKAMPRSGRTNALRAWISHHANVRWSDAAYKKTGGYIKAKKGEAREVTLSEAIDKPFYEQIDREPTKFNAERRVASFITAFTKALDAGEITAEQWEAVRAKVAETKLA